MIPNHTLPPIELGLKVHSTCMVALSSRQSLWSRFLPIFKGGLSTDADFMRAFVQP